MKKFIVFFAFILSGLLLVGCGSKIYSVELVDSTIPDEIEAGTVDVTTFQIKITYADHTIEYANLRKSNFAPGEYEKFNQVGSQTIRLSYEKNNLEIKIKVIERKVILGKFTVIFRDPDGSILKTEIVEEGSSATPPTISPKEGVTFVGWDKALSPITANVEITAQYEIVKLTVRFLDYDGKVLKTEQVIYGWSATPPTAPVRIGFTFTGWNKDLTAIKSNLDVQAQYSISKFTVRFLDYDKTVLKTELVDYGKGASAPTPPTRTGYLFIGWDKVFTNITKNEDITAVYAVELNFTVRFLDYDGTVLKVEFLEAGQTATPPTPPIRAGYTFTNWDTAFNNIQKSIDIYAVYKENAPTYVVRFLDFDGKEIKVETVEQGKDAIAPSNPTRVGYLFTGWDKSFTGVAGDLDVKAEYSVIHSKVRFLDYDGTVLKTESVDYGKDATAPASPTRVGYIFTGWDKTFTTITSDLDVKALYAIQKLTIRFLDYDGTVLKTDIIEYGKDATAPASPTRVGYIFTSWDKTFTTITNDLDVKALYAIQRFTIRFLDYDGTVLKTEVVEYGKDATAPSNPTRLGYAFVGWDKSYTTITINLDVLAQYAVLKLTVRFLDHDGVVLKTETVEYGKGADAPTLPTREGYIFTGWDQTFAVVTSDLDVLAIYQKVVVKYEVKFYDYDETLLAIVYVEEDKDATPPANPNRLGYKFVGWDSSFEKVNKDLVVHAMYEVDPACINLIIIESGSASFGETIEISIWIRGVVNFASYDVHLQYDATALKLNKEILGIYVDCVNASVPGEILFNYVNIKNKTEDAYLITFVFEVTSHETRATTIEPTYVQVGTITPDYRVVSSEYSVISGTIHLN